MARGRSSDDRLVRARRFRERVMLDILQREAPKKRWTTRKQKGKSMKEEEESRGINSQIFGADPMWTGSA